MTNSKNTKRALLSSALALLVCVAMLIGTTFAWFTDTASTAVNKIQAGTLDIALEMKEGDEWVSAEGKTLNFKAADNRTNILWEPGCTYELPELRIVNKGNLALKYKVVISGINGDAKLNEAIDWYYSVELSSAIPGATGWTEPSDLYTLDNFGEEDFLLTEGNADNARTDASVFKIIGKMRTDAGNEYQGLSIDGIAITVVATQYTYENDSYGRLYDENAQYDEGTVVAAGVMQAEDGTYLISNAAGLNWFADQVNVKNNGFNGKTVKLTADIDLANELWTPVGQTGATVFKGTFDGNNKTIKNLKIDENQLTLVSDADGIGLFGWLQGTVKDLTIDTATIEGARRIGAVAGVNEFGTITNCVVKNATITAIHKDDERCGDKVGGVVGMLQPNTTVKVTDCKVMNSTIKAGRDAGQVIGMAYPATNTISGNTAVNVTVSATTGCTGANITNGIIGRQ